MYVSKWWELQKEQRVDCGMKNARHNSCHYHWNFAALLGINFRKTSTCRATIFNFKSSMPLLSSLLWPCPYTTVRSGTTSPGPISHKGPILQCFHGIVSTYSLNHDEMSHLPQYSPFANLRIDFNHAPFSDFTGLNNSTNLNDNPVLNNDPFSVLRCSRALPSNLAAFANDTSVSNGDGCKCRTQLCPWVYDRVGTNGYEMGAC